MTTTPVIDAHCHVWPDHIAAQVLAGNPAGLAPQGDGTLDGLARSMDAAGIALAACLGVALTARTVARTNEFLGGVDRSRFLPFGTVHPDLPVAENLAYLRDNGIVGVKFHPNFQGVSLGDPRVWEIFAALADSRIPVITHVGAGDDAAATARGASHWLAEIIRQVPTLTLIACHFGGYHDLAEAERTAVGSGAYLETSWPPSTGDLPVDRIRALIRRQGTDRIIFGSDWPMTDHRRELDAIRRLELSADDEAAVLGGNLARLLGLPGTTASAPQPSDEPSDRAGT